MEAAALNELIRTRRSVFPSQFVPGKPVSRDIIEQILINATWAPTTGKPSPGSLPYSAAWD